MNAIIIFIDANKVHLEARIGALEEERDTLLASVEASHEQVELLQRTVRSRELTVSRDSNRFCAPNVIRIRIQISVHLHFHVLNTSTRAKSLCTDRATAGPDDRVAADGVGAAGAGACAARWTARIGRLSRALSA